MLLAYNENSPVQAYQYKNIFATQFHSDLPSQNLVNLLELKKDRYYETGLIKDEAHYQNIKNSLHLGEAAYSILEKFLDLDIPASGEIASK